MLQGILFWSNSAGQGEHMNEELRRQIGRRIREFRVSLALTQDEFAEELGVSQRQSISAWELGKALPRGEEWIKLGHLGMSLDYTVLGIRTIPVGQYGQGSLCHQASQCTVRGSTAVPSP